MVLLYLAFYRQRYKTLAGWPLVKGPMLLEDQSEHHFQTVRNAKKCLPTMFYVQIKITFDESPRLVLSQQTTHLPLRTYIVYDNSRAVHQGNRRETQIKTPERLTIFRGLIHSAMLPYSNKYWNDSMDVSQLCTVLCHDWKDKKLRPFKNELK